MIINSESIYIKAHSDLNMLNESYLVGAKSADEKIAFYTRARILLALYTRAYEVNLNRRKYEPGFSTLLTSNVISLAASILVIEKLEMHYKNNLNDCKYFFEYVNCGCGSIKLNVCLKNIHEFDSADFDTEYGDNSAELAINNYLERISQPPVVINVATSIPHDGSLLAAIRKRSAAQQMLRANAGSSPREDESTPFSPRDYFRRGSSILLASFRSSESEVTAKSSIASVEAPLQHEIDPSPSVQAPTSPSFLKRKLFFKSIPGSTISNNELSYPVVTETATRSRKSFFMF